MSPWNGGSGFYSGDKKARDEIALIEGDDQPRLHDYRETLEVARNLVQRAQEEGWEPKDAKHKERFIQRCRAHFPDRAVAWLDAAVVLTGSGLSFPTLLGGSGGNLGRLDLSANFMARLGDALRLRTGRSAPTRADSQAWLSAALFRGPTSGVKASIGQFDPVGASGPTSSAFGAADSLVNPWDVVLLLEGALLFASGAARRLGVVTGGSAAMPFMVASSPVGYPSGAAEENGKGEVWAPLWSRPATAAEVSRLIGEGRSTWRRRQARNGLDFARAATSLGVDRGIDAFARHALVERHGQSPLAVPAGRFAVAMRPQVPVLGQLDGWLERVRRASDLPSGVASALRRLDAAMFEVAAHGGSVRLQQVLIETAELEAAIGRSGGLRERAGLDPVPEMDNRALGLNAGEWLPQLLGDNPGGEVLLAAALASQRDQDGACLRFLLTPVRPAPPSPAGKSRRLKFTGAAPPVSGLGHRPLVEVLAEALVARTRQVEARGRHEASLAAGDSGRAEENRPDGERDVSQVGVPMGYDACQPAPAPAIARLLQGDLDEPLLTRLLAGMLLLSGAFRPSVHDPGGAALAHLASPAFGVLAPFFHWQTIDPGDGRASFRPLVQPTWPSRLRAGAVASVLEEAHLRLRMAGLEPAVRHALPPVDPRGWDRATGTRLCAALLVPLRGIDAQVLLRRVAPPPLTDHDADRDPVPAAPLTKET